ncbi:FHA domain-containing protein [Actinokineospora inagensis]|uniref:FHA domain-containing protein n=1 Tax=Actinokineospora inagensis TaxID=103730 RepID=UPI00041710CA|nr:FHA domain-containing protein [Actinokineospora inagensis]
MGRFCEVDGYDSLLPPSGQAIQRPSVRTWSVTVAADRAYYDATKASTSDLRLEFPRFLPPRRFDLIGVSLLVGRSDPTRGVRPDIDLGSPPEDTAVGRGHAMFVPHEHGWAVVDLESVNHTFVNNIHTPIPPQQPFPLTNGDRVYLGAWTVLTLHRL